MPAAMFWIVVTHQYRGDGPLAARLIIATSLVSACANAPSGKSGNGRRGGLSRDPAPLPRGPTSS
jgi:hypothetical protein